MTIFKPLAADDRVSTKTLLHEAIPITGTILSVEHIQMETSKTLHMECFNLFMTILI